MFHVQGEAQYSIPLPSDQLLSRLTNASMQLRQYIPPRNIAYGKAFPTSIRKLKTESGDRDLISLQFLQNPWEGFFHFQHRISGRISSPWKCGEAVLERLVVSGIISDHETWLHYLMC